MQMHILKSNASAAGTVGCLKWHDLAHFLELLHGLAPSNAPASACVCLQQRNVVKKLQAHSVLGWMCMWHAWGAARPAAVQVANKVG